MEMNEYQLAAQKTAIYPQNLAVIYPAIGLAGETGEVAEKVKKAIRDDGGTFTPERREAIARELGDVLWYVALIAHDLGLTLDDVARLNVEKITSRQRRRVQHGSGDNR